MSKPCFAPFRQSRIPFSTLSLAVLPLAVQHATDHSNDAESESTNAYGVSKHVVRPEHVSVACPLVQFFRSCNLRILRQVGECCNKRSTVRQCNLETNSSGSYVVRS